MNIRRLLPYLFLGLFLLAFSSTSVNRAAQKSFWVDEGFEITENCGGSVFGMLQNGATKQCSPHPFYYMIEGGFVRAASVLSPDPFVSLRLPSLFFALVLLGSLFLFLNGNFGFLVAAAAVLALSQQEIFHYFAAESRIYMFWITLYTFAALATLRFCRETEAGGKPSVTALVFFLSQALLASTVAPGMMQAWGFCLVVFLVWVGAAGAEWRKVIMPSLLRLLPTLATTIVIGLYYSSKSCEYNTNAGPLDLLDTMDLGLIKNIFRFFLPLLPHWAWPTYALSLSGMAWACWGIWQFLRRRQCGLRHQIALLIAIQSIVAVVTGLAVALAHYYFLPRVFLQLLVLQAFLVALGALWLLDRNKRWPRVLLPLLLILSAASSWPHWNEHLQILNNVESRSEACVDLKFPVQLWFGDGHDYGDKLNVFALMLRERRQCPALRPGKDPTRLMVYPEEKKFLSPASQPPEGFTPGMVCNRPMEIR